MTSVHLLPHQLTRRVEAHEIGQRLTSVQRFEIREDTVIPTADEELVVVVIAGSVAFEHASVSGTATLRDTLYVPWRDALTLRAQGDELPVVMAFWVPCDRVTQFAHLPFAEADADARRHNVYGDAEASTLRDVWDVIDGDFDSQRVLCGQAKGALGGWTAWPPHEHTLEREETYVYFDLDGSFGVQLAYDDEDGMDEPHSVSLVREGHLVSIPRGFHPSVGSPAGGISYIYFMASHEREDRDFMNLRIQSAYGTTFN